VAVAKGNELLVSKLLAYARLPSCRYVASQARASAALLPATTPARRFYSTIGRPSLDPIVFVKLLLVQHLENITSDRKLVELASLHVGIRAFLGYEFTHPLPSHSTVSRTR
jgi:hypothetical protein